MHGLAAHHVVCSVACSGTDALPYQFHLILACMHFSRAVRRYAAVAPKPLPMWDSMKLCAAFYTDEFLKSQYRPHTNKNGRWDFIVILLWHHARVFILYFIGASSSSSGVLFCAE
jgi:hypothetical protein